MSFSDSEGNVVANNIYYNGIAAITCFGFSVLATHRNHSNIATFILYTPTMLTVLLDSSSPHARSAMFAIIHGIDHHWLHPYVNQRTGYDRTVSASFDVLLHWLIHIDNDLVFQGVSDDTNHSKSIYKKYSKCIHFFSAICFVFSLFRHNDIGNILFLSTLFPQILPGSVFFGKAVSNIQQCRSDKDVLKTVLTRVTLPSVALYTAIYSNETVRGFYAWSRMVEAYYLCSVGAPMLTKGAKVFLNHAVSSGMRLWQFVQPNHREAHHATVPEVENRFQKK